MVLIEFYRQGISYCSESDVQRNVRRVFSDFHCRHDGNNWSFTNSFSQWNSDSISVGEEPIFKELEELAHDQFSDICATGVKAIKMMASKNNYQKPYQKPLQNFQKEHDTHT
jgi:hypothetical protein